MPPSRNKPRVSPVGELHPLSMGRLSSGDWEEMDPLDRRALQIESAFYREAEARGHHAERGSLHIDGHAFTLEIYEAGRAVRERLTRKDPGYRKDAVQWRQAWEPSGLLTLIIQIEGWGGKRRWTDRPGKLLETQASRLILHFERLAREKASHDARYEAYQREAEIARRQTAHRVFKEQERKRRPTVVRTLAAQWEEAARLRAFLDVLERCFAPPTPSMREWLAAARDDIDKLDPLSPSRLQALEFHADAVASAPEDEGPRHPDQSYWFDEGAMDELVDEMFGDVRLRIGGHLTS